VFLATTLGKVAFWEPGNQALPSVQARTLGKLCTLPSVQTRTLGKLGTLPSVHIRTLGKPPHAVMATFVCRVLIWHSVKTLPSVRHMTLGKASFNVKIFVVLALPGVALGKRFAECFLLFAECRRH